MGMKDRRNALWTRVIVGGDDGEDTLSAIHTSYARAGDTAVA